MHYIYIHRYTINYNKVREARLFPPGVLLLLFLFVCFPFTSLYRNLIIKSGHRKSLF